MPHLPCASGHISCCCCQCNDFHAAEATAGEPIQDLDSKTVSRKFDGSNSWFTQASYGNSAGPLCSGFKSMASEVGGQLRWHGPPHEFVVPRDHQNQPRLPGSPRPQIPRRFATMTTVMMAE